MNPQPVSLKVCSVCPRNCQVERNKKLGVCRKGNEIEISWFGPHFGEEPPISGTKGSGTIFFSGCNLSCVYCQNWQISQENVNSKKYSIDEVVDIFFKLRDMGCHNINLVSPTIWTLSGRARSGSDGQLIKVIKIAKKKGLTIPVIWNSNAYEKVETLKKLEGLVDIYLPDYKYSDNLLSLKYSNAPIYSIIAQKAIKEMYRQVGDLKINKKGIAGKGIIVRHLLLPNSFDNSAACLRFIRQISPDIHLSLMSQYNPVYKAIKTKTLNRKIKAEEYRKIKSLVGKLNFKYGWFQEYDSQECFNPDFNKKNPFVSKT